MKRGRGGGVSKGLLLAFVVSVFDARAGAVGVGVRGLLACAGERARERAEEVQVETALGGVEG